MIGSLAPLLRARVAGRLGNGHQWVPWIDLADLVEMIVSALGDERWRGPVYGVSPAPVTNRTLTAALASALGGAAPLPVPAFALRALLGERARTLLDSQRSLPVAAQGWGFRFAFPALAPALDDLAAGARGVSMSRVEPGDAPAVPYLEARRPRYILETEIELATLAARGLRLLRRRRQPRVADPARPRLSHRDAAAHRDGAGHRD